MNSRERVRSAIQRRGWDRIPVHHEGTPEVNAMQRKHFSVADDLALAQVLGDDWRYVEPAYSADGVSDRVCFGSQLWRLGLVHRNRTLSR